MIYLKTKKISPLLQQQLIKIWNEEYPAILKHYTHTFQEYLSRLKNVQSTLVLDELGSLVGWYFDFDS